MRPARVHTLCIALLAIAATTVAACGGSSAPPPPGSPQNPLRAKEADQIPATADGRSNEAGAPSGGRGRGPGYEQLLEGQSRHPGHRFAPCNLVTRAQARAIAGAPMREPIEAAQGPTCVYRSRDGRIFVTLAVQTLDLGQVRPHMKLRRRVTVAGRTAYCGTYGQPVLYVPLSRGRVLSVGAQCDMARGFAARAVRQLRG
jgi:hypothetical protein